MLEAKSTSSDTISLDDLPLPCVHFNGGVHALTLRDELKYLQGDAVKIVHGKSYFPYKLEWWGAIVPQWYWAADDKWYQAVEIKKIRKASWWKRFVGPDDLMVADFKLMEIDGIGDHWMYYYRMLHGCIEVGNKDLTKEDIKRARKELRQIKHSKDMVLWLLQFTDKRY